MRLRLIYFITLALFFLNGVAFAQVGIGTTTPDAKALLDLKVGATPLGLLLPRMNTATRIGPFQAGMGPAQMGMVVADTTNGSTGGLWVWNGTTWNRIQTGETPWVRQSTNVVLENPGDKVGVGINTPKTRLHVVGTEASVSSIVENSGSAKWTALGTGISGSALEFSDNFYIQYQNNAALKGDLIGLTRMMINGSNGFVGIGTSSPLAKLHLKGDFMFDTDGESQIRNNADPSQYLYFLPPTAGTPYGRIGAYQGPVTPLPLVLQSAYGSVGIGVTNPIATLDVEGDIRASSLVGPDDGVVLADASGVLFKNLVTGSITDVLRGNGTWGPAPGGPWGKTGNHISPGILADSVSIGSSIPLAKLYVENGRILARTANGAYTALQMEQLGGPLGDEGMLANFGGDMYLRGYWGVNIDRKGGNGSDASYTNGSNPDAGSFAVRYRTGLNTFRTDLIVRNSGNVGIGTTNPGAKLEIMAPSGRSMLIGERLTWAGGNWNTLYSNDIQEYVMVHNLHIPYLQSGVNGFNGSSIGARIRFGGNVSAVGPWDWGISAPNTDKFTLDRNSINFLTILNNGNFGVLSSNPQHLMNLGGNTADAQTVGLRVHSNAPANWKGSGAFGYTSATVILGEINGMPQIGGHDGTLSTWKDLLLNSGGSNVGIGIQNNTVEGALDVYRYAATQTAWNPGGYVPYGTEQGDLILTRRHGASVAGLGFLTNVIDFRATNVANQEATIAQILTTVDPNGGSAFSGGIGLATSPGGTVDPTGRRNTGTAPVVRMWINYLGNIGIGNTAPAYKLDVTGDINVSLGNGYKIDGGAPLGQFLRGNGSRFVASTIGLADLPSGLTGTWTRSGSFVTLANIGDNVGIGTATPGEKLDVMGNLLVQGKYVVQNSIDGGPNRGIYMWNAGDANWGIYMGQSGAGRSLAGGTAVAGAGFGQHAIRIRTTNSVNQGVLIENSIDQLNMSVRGSDGQFYVRGNMSIGSVTVPTATLDLAGNMRARDGDVFLRGDDNHGIGFYGGAKTFAGVNLDGAAVYGFSGGALGVRTGPGSEIIALRWLQNGRVGVGNTNPQHQLHVGDALADTQPVMVRSLGGSGLTWRGGGAFGGNSNTVIMGELSGVAVLGAHNGNLSAWSDLNINPSGANVSIGFFGPQNRLDVAADARSGSHATGLPLYVTGAIGDQNNGVEFRHSNGTQGIGIGYNTIYAAGSNVDQNLGLKAKGTVGEIVMITNNTSRMVVKGNGNVGINVANPGGKFQVNNTVSNYMQYDANGFINVVEPEGLTGQVLRVGAAWSKLGLYSANNPLSLATNGSFISFVNSGTEIGRWDANGNLGIGANAPSNAIEIIRDNANVAITYHDPGDIWYTQGVDRGDGVKFKLNNGGNFAGTNLLTITPTGELGINTTVPNERLTVNGNIGFTDVNTLIGFAAANNNAGGAITIQARNRIFSGGCQFGSDLNLLAGDRNSDGTNCAAGGNIFIRSGGNAFGATSNGFIAFQTRMGTTTFDRMRILDNGFVGIGTNTPGQLLHVNGQVQASCGILVCSDQRYKRDIRPIDNALARIQQLQGMYYYWRTEEFKDMGFNDERQLGVIAQEVEKQFPEAVHTNADGYKTVDYAKLVPVLIQAMKEQEARHETERTDIMKLMQTLADQNADMQVQLQQLRQDLEEAKMEK